MSDKKIESFELVDHGIDSPSYFQGCGTAFTDYKHCVTGNGDNPREALDDLLEQVAQYVFPIDPTDHNKGFHFFDISDLEDRIVADVPNQNVLVDGKFPEEPSAHDEMMEANGISEPDKDDYETEEEYDEAYEEYEQQMEGFEGCEGNYYYLSLRWK